MSAPVRRGARPLVATLAALALGAAAPAAPAPAATPVPAAPAEPKRAILRRQLETRLERLRSDLPGVAGYFIRDLATGETFEAEADAIFPAASTIKVPILLSLLKRAAAGSLELDAPIPIDRSGRVEGGGVLEKWSEPYPALSAVQLAVLMMDFSDNYATNVLIDRIGMERVEADLRAWGLRRTRLRRKMMDLEAARAGRENVATPREMAGLLEALHRGAILDAAGTARAIAIMTRNAGTPIKRGLPAGVAAADKEGDLDGVRCASGIVLLPARPFVLSVMTAYLADDAAGNPYITATTRAAHDYFATLAAATEHGRRLGP